MSNDNNTENKITSTFWPKRLETKLNNLSEQSSDDTHKALAKWIGFNRKHALAFSTIFRSALIETTPTPSTTKQFVLLSVLHQVFVLDHDTTKYDRNAELRLIFGEHIILPFAKHLASTSSTKEVATKLLEYIKEEWDSDDINAINNPTLISQIKRQLVQVTKSTAASNTIKKESETAVSASASSPTPPQEQQQATPTTSATTTSKVKEEEEKASETKIPSAVTDKAKATSTISASASSATPSTSTKTKDPTSSSTTTSTSYDFESKGIPASSVSPDSLLGPCQEIATVQISRDLSNDGAVQLSSLLTNLPQDVRLKCAEAADSDAKIELDKNQAHGFSLKVNEVLIDMDLDDQLKNIHVFRNLIIQQHQARQQLLKLLIQSRCQFGANDAAEAFHQADRATSELLKRKQILADAMELEGLDINMDVSERSGTSATGGDNKDETSKKKKKERQFAPLAWYKPISSSGDGGAETTAAPEAKRQRTE